VRTDTRHWPGLALLAALPLLALTVAGCERGEARPVVAAPPVAVAAVKAHLVADRILVTGELLAVNEASVAAEVDGRVTSILVEEGAAVEKGAAVFEIDRERRRLERANASAGLEEAIARFEQQKRDTERIRRLSESKSTSAARLDSAEAELRLARSRLAAAKAGLGLAERALRKASVTAPFSGIVARRHVSEGEFITPGRELFDLVSLDPIEVEFRVPERDSGRIEMGQALDVRVAPFPDETFHATVNMVSPRIDPRTRTLRIKALIENCDSRLRPGLFARADLGLAERADVPMIPESAILQRADGSVAFRLAGDDRVERVVVTTGVFRDGNAEILAGLRVGDRVVVRGHARLVDGAAVDVRTPAGEPAEATAIAGRESAE
jgi:membrane fusion protein (multidrug efflux system)